MRIKEKQRNDKKERKVTRKRELAQQLKKLANTATIKGSEYSD